jgi:murein DD-endopeptidase MepM/ murein hydrolase activator NlpD
MRPEVKELLVIGGLAMVVASARKKVPWGTGWMWPVPDMLRDDHRYRAVISHEFEGARHAGVDIMYQRRSPSDLIAEFPRGTNGNAKFFAPPSTPIVAARDGRVWFAAKQPRGWTVVLDHGSPWLTFYTHLDVMHLKPHVGGYLQGTKQVTHVARGDVIGTMGFDPLDGAKLRHLHFSPWLNGWGERYAVDPAEAMASWDRAQWTPNTR